MAEDELASVKVFRYDPDVDSAPRYDEYRVPYLQRTVLDVLRDIFENHDTTYFIYNDTVLIWNYKQDLIAIKVESKMFTRSQKQIFNFLWSIAKK